MRPRGQSGRLLMEPALYAAHKSRHSGSSSQCCHEWLGYIYPSDNASEIGTLGNSSWNYNHQEQESTYTILCSSHQEMTEVTRSSRRLSLLVLFWLKEIILTPRLRESPRTLTGHLSGEHVLGSSWSSVYKLTRWYPSPIPQMLSATNWPVL